MLTLKKRSGAGISIQGNFAIAIGYVSQVYDKLRLTTLESSP